MAEHRWGVPYIVTYVRTTTDGHTACAEHAARASDDVGREHAPFRAQLQPSALAPHTAITLRFHQIDAWHQWYTS